MQVISQCRLTELLALCNRSGHGKAIPHFAQWVSYQLLLCYSAVYVRVLRALTGLADPAQPHCPGALPALAKDQNPVSVPQAISQATAGKQQRWFPAPHSPVLPGQEPHQPGSTHRSLSQPSLGLSSSSGRCQTPGTATALVLPGCPVPH